LVTDDWFTGSTCDPSDAVTNQVMPRPLTGSPCALRTVAVTTV
jgi:hypothetical protein